MQQTYLQLQGGGWSRRTFCDVPYLNADPIEGGDDYGKLCLTNKLELFELFTKKQLCKYFLNAKLQ